MKRKNESALRRWLRGDLDLLGSEEVYREYKKTSPSKPQKHDWGGVSERVERGEIRSFQKLYGVVAAIMVLLLSAALILTVTQLPRYGEKTVPANNEVPERYVERGLEETGAVNAVTAMILDYRAFDTLGESHVLFTAVCVVMLLLFEQSDATEERVYDSMRDPVLTGTTRVLVPVIILFGVYIILNGHLSPGGGFAGGAIIGAGLMLHSVIYGAERTAKLVSLKTFRTVTLISLLFYSLAKGYSFYMGAHHLNNGIPLGTPGNIISSGLILPLNIAVGLVVACTMYGIYSLFGRGRI